MLAHKLMGATSAAKLYVDDVFSTYLYTGTGATQTINNGIDLAGKGGLVWLKPRTGTLGSNTVVDTARGAGKWLYTNMTSAQNINASYIVTSFNSNGFTLGLDNNGENASGSPVASWTFRKAPRFFDVVTFTANSNGEGSASHSLGVTPGVVIVKQTNDIDNWYVYHRSLTAGNFFTLNSSSSQISGNFVTSVTASSVAFGQMNPNAQCVAYLFAHDPSADGIIQCGSFTTAASGNASVTSIGWEPQFLMVKASSTAGDWIMLDSMRGWNMTASDAKLAANLVDAESLAEYGNPTATGFDFKGGTANATYVYMVIRRPNKPPTSGRDVFSLNAYGLTTSGGQIAGYGNSNAVATDMVMLASRDGDSRNFQIVDRVRGFQTSIDTTAQTYTSPTLVTSSTAAETVAGNMVFQNYGDSNSSYIDTMCFDTYTNAKWLGYRLKRAPGFFDVVCYTGTGVNNRDVPHNLGAVPEMIIFKGRNNSLFDWFVSHSEYAAGRAGLALNSSDVPNWSILGGRGRTASNIYLYPVNTNTSNITYVAYLFASCPGVSKVGSYTGNGTSQTINCGFSLGARFILIKRTDAVGNWYVWDTARGINPGLIPYLTLNNTSAEVDSTSDIQPANYGFSVNQNSGVDINVSGGSYIYLAIA